jgi:tetratricopeptide (TPR) repeat protein
VRLRRRQKWLFAFLALVFGVSFAFIGVGSGNSGGLSQLYSGIFGGGGNSISKAQKEVKKDPAKGYRELATAYETKSDTTNAVSALNSYLAIKKNDANAWSELGGLQLSQAQTYLTQYQAAQQASQVADPSAPFQPGGSLGTAIGTNAAYSGAAQQASTTTSTLYQQLTGALSGAVTSYQKVTKIHPHDSNAQEQLAQTAQNAGNAQVALGAWKAFLKLAPHSTDAAYARKQIKSLSKSVPQTKPKVRSSHGK